MIEKLIEILGNKPKAGFSVSSGSFLGGFVIDYIHPATLAMVSDLLQIVAFLVTIVVGIMTGVGVYRKNKSEKNKGEKLT